MSCVESLEIRGQEFCAFVCLFPTWSWHMAELVGEEVSLEEAFA